jgi:hypothetical protein
MPHYEVISREVHRIVPKTNAITWSRLPCHGDFAFCHTQSTT